MNIGDKVKVIALEEGIPRNILGQTGVIDCMDYGSISIGVRFNGGILWWFREQDLVLIQSNRFHTGMEVRCMEACPYWERGAAVTIQQFDIDNVYVKKYSHGWWVSQSSLVPLGNLPTKETTEYLITQIDIMVLSGKEDIAEKLYNALTSYDYSMDKIKKVIGVI